MKFYSTPTLSLDELVSKLLSNLEDKNYNNCWCKIEHEDKQWVVRLLDFRDGYYAFFDYHTDKITSLPYFKLLRQEEFKIIWVGKGKGEDDEELIFGKDLEDSFKEALSWCNINGNGSSDSSDSDSSDSGSGSGSDSDSDSDSSDCTEVSEVSDGEDSDLLSDEEYQRQKAIECCSEYECSDGELDLNTVKLE